VGADQGDDRAWHQQHVNRVEARESGRAELRAGPQEIAQVGTEHRAGAVDVDADDRGPEGALIEGQQVAGEGHRHRQDQQHDADHPVELARILVGTEEEGAAHVQEDQNHHQARAPLVHAVHELAEEDVVVDVGDRGVGLRGRGRVVHRQEDPGDSLGDEGEERGRAERVEPVGPLRHLAVEQAGEEAGGGGALVDPGEDVNRGLHRALGDPLGVGRTLGGGRLQVGRGSPLGAVALAGLGRFAKRSGNQGIELHRRLAAQLLGGGKVDGRGG